MGRFSSSLLLFSLALGAGACTNDVELAFGGCEVDGKTIAFGVPATGPCGEECVCVRGGQLECGPSLCVDPDPDPVPQPCVVDNVSIPPGQSLLIETSCETCSCPATGASDMPGAGVTCNRYEQQCPGLPPGCTEMTEETCTECARCSCEPPPMGCPTEPECFYPYQGMCSFNGGDYCGERMCNPPPVCAPSPPVGLPDPACRVSLMCDPNLGWSKQETLCACGDIEPCEMGMPMDPDCRLQASCDPQLPMKLLCEETCQCDDPQMCPFPFVFEASIVNPMCGTCRLCASCDAIECPSGYECFAEQMTMCGSCFPR